MPDQSSMLQRSLRLSPLSQREHRIILKSSLITFLLISQNLKNLINVKKNIPFFKNCVFQSTLRNIYDRHELVRQDVKQVRSHPLIKSCVCSLTSWHFFSNCCILWRFVFQVICFVCDTEQPVIFIIISCLMNYYDDQNHYFQCVIACEIGFVSMCFLGNSSLLQLWCQHGRIFLRYLQIL